MYKRISAALILLSALVLPTLAQQARLTTKDGNVFVGVLEPVEKGVYGIQTSVGLIRIPASAVRQIEMLDAGEAPAPAATPAQKIMPSAGQGKLRLAGSNTIGAKLVPKLLEGFGQSIGDAQQRWIAGAETEEQSLTAKGTNGDIFMADVSAHGSATAFTALANGAADIGMASRSIKPDEQQHLASLGLGDLTSPEQEHVLALDGVAVLVNAGNPLNQLSLSQIADIFSGDKKDWADFGGKPGPITIYSRDDKSGTFDTFKTLVLQDRKLAVDAKRFESNEDLSDAVAADGSSIGFASLAYIRNTKPLSIATDCGLVFAPTEFLVKTEDYPLSRRLFLYSRADGASSRAAPFIEYALSPSAQKIVADAGFINLQMQPSSAAYVADRLGQADKAQSNKIDIASAKKFDVLAKNASRLSVAFRFHSGTARLDSRAVRDIARLAEVLKQPGFQGKQIALAGFSDGVGRAASNLYLSLERASAVAAALRLRGVTAPVAEGFGAAGPVACDETPQGLEKNRRVEVWVH
jgi:phosphate transport system substrate-binding protein